MSFFTTLKELFFPPKPEIYATYTFYSGGRWQNRDNDVTVIDIKDGWVLFKNIKFKYTRSLELNAFNICYTKVK
jgi:hypothetical protein